MSLSSDTSTYVPNSPSVRDLTIHRISSSLSIREKVERMARYHEQQSALIQSAGFLTRIEHPHRDYGYRELFRYSTKKEKIYLLIGLICAILSGVCAPLMVWQFGQMTNAMVVIDIIDTDRAEFTRPGGKYTETTPPFCWTLPDDIHALIGDVRIETKNQVITDHINSFVLWHTVFAAFLTILSFIYFICWFIGGENQINRLSVAYFEAMLRKDMKWMDVRADSAEYVSSIVEHTLKIREGVGERVATAGFLISVFVASMAMALLHGWELSLVAFVAIPLLIGATSVVATTEANQVVEESKAFAKAAAHAQQVLLNIRTVIVYGGQRKEFAEFHARLDGDEAGTSSYSKFAKRVGWASLANGAVWFITYANYALSFWYGAKLVLEDRENCSEEDRDALYTPGDLVIIFFGIMFGAINIGLAFPIVESMLIASKSAKEMFRIIDTTSEVDNLSLDGFVPQLPTTGQIQLQDVFFTYPSRKNVPILKGITLTVLPGQTVALVGTSGCGKSTILKLLTKEYLADSGFIKVDGVDVRYYNTVWLRSQIAVVTQESSLFDDTIEENVRIGKPTASFAEIKSACKKANAHEFITQLKRGYQTMVGFQGSKLSGGQRQRISIARALIRDPKILLLDEPTSALDNQSEAVVQEALRRASQNRTTFVVAHRLNTIIHSDLIVVFNRGQVAERGTHFELLSQKGLYFQLATGLYNKPSTSDPKLDDEKMNTALAERDRRKSLKALDFIITSPYHNSISTPVSNAIARHLINVQKRTSSATPADEDQDLVFTINPIVEAKLVESEQLAAAAAALAHGQGDSLLMRMSGSAPEAEVAAPEAADQSSDLALAVASAISKRSSGSGPRKRSTSITPNSNAERALEMEFEMNLWQRYSTHLESQDLLPVGVMPQRRPGEQIAFEPADETAEPPGKAFEFYRVLRMVSLNPVLILLGLIGSIGMGCTLPLYGVIFGEIVGELSGKVKEEALANAAMLSLLFLAVGGLAGISVFTQSFTLSMAGFKAVNRVRKRLLFAMLRQDVGWFDDPDNGISALDTRLNADAGSTQYVVLSFYGVLVQCFATVTIAIVYCFFFAWRLTAYCLFLVPIVIGASWLDGWLAKLHEERTSQAMDDISKIVLEVFQNRRVVLTSQLERHFINKYEKALLNSGKSGWKIGILRSLSYGFAQAAAFWTYSLCIYLAGFEITRPENPVEYKDVLKVGDGLIFALLTVGTSLAIIPSFVKALAAGNRILRILRTKPRFDFEVGGSQVETTRGALEFKQVQFWYPHATDVHTLRGVSFSVRPGEMVALVGSSGSGKSTCVQLILRFHEATGGVVSLDGVDVKELNCASMRSHMALVEQDPRLFDRTVAENIAYGDNSRVVDLTEVIDAAQAADIHTFITSLPEGYQTKVGSSGSLLSGGQKQRIAIARALLRKPQILVLDEATAALDRESEKVVGVSLEAARVGRTCIAVAHRLSSIQQADLIVVMHQGHIIEFGNHDTLLAKRGLYSLLWMAQNPLANDSFVGSLPLTAGNAPVADAFQELAEFAKTAIGAAEYALTHGHGQDMIGLSPAATTTTSTTGDGGPGASAATAAADLAKKPPGKI